MHWRIYSICLATAFCASAANEPIRVSFSCNEADLTAAGLTCSDDDPCPVYLELSGISGVGKNLSLAGDLHGRAVTLSTVLLASDDNGVTWKEPVAGIPGAALEQIQLIDARHGWSAGETQVPLARDPFVLITSDGGASWRRKLLAEEGTAGAVQRFWFDTVNHGELIVESGRTYTLYESDTGGVSWNVESKTAQIPRLRQAPPAGDAEFRIGTDSRTHTYTIERRDGEKWTRLASFLIQVASCGSAPPPEPASDGK